MLLGWPLHALTFAGRMSKLLAYLLRHGAVQEGLNPHGDGWVEVRQLTDHRKIAQFERYVTPDG